MRWLKELSPNGVEPDDGGTWSLNGVTTCGSSSSNFGCAIGDAPSWHAMSVAFHFGVSSPSGVPGEEACSTARGSPTWVCIDAVEVEDDRLGAELAPWRSCVAAAPTKCLL